MFSNVTENAIWGSHSHVQSLILSIHILFCYFVHRHGDTWSLVRDVPATLHVPIDPPAGLAGVRHDIFNGEKHAKGLCAVF